MIDKIRSLPHSAGIYQYLNAKGQILYIGKAKDLSKRVKSYFNLTPTLTPKSTLSLRIQKMLSETISLQYIVVDKEHDALILENSLIKQLAPKYNVLLRDDKTYPYIYIDLNESYPRFDITRKIINGKNVRYFGPYSTGARDILDSLYELLPLVQKKSCLKGKKVCLYYQMHQCLGPCELPVDISHYRSLVDTAISWIENKKLLAPKLIEKMEYYAQELRFEEAMGLRDRLERIEKSVVTCAIDLARNVDFDIFAIELHETRGCVVRMFIREGKITSSSHDFFPITDHFSLDEGYERALLNFYGIQKPPIIAPILTAHPFEEKEWIEEHLTKIFEKKAILESPKIGIKKQLTQLALTNAQELLKTHKPSNHPMLQSLKELLELENFPHRIEIFDNSHMGGVATVGAMVVYTNGSFEKKSYRQYHLHERDEYGQMREMLLRRIESFDTNPPPDLWILDGGSTLRNLALELLHSHGISMDVIAISKEKLDAKAHRAKGSARDILHIHDNTLRLEPYDKRLQFIQLLRDEAHRSAITFHKKTKLKRDQESKFLSQKGITLPKIYKLLEYYGTFEEIEKGTFETLCELIGTKDARIIQNLSHLEQN
ncbi:MAG TPA: excinuclease ABC subunit UvrC [Sulfuricurvum sp.]|nr:excinuclease ABC subunit UvrC [Sulfuricurvum sp.]